MGNFLLKRYENFSFKKKRIKKNYQEQPIQINKNP